MEGEDDYKEHFHISGMYVHSRSYSFEKNDAFGQHLCRLIIYSYIILLYPDERRPCVAMTPWVTPHFN